MQIVLLLTTLFLIDASPRNTEVKHQLIWSSNAIHVYRVELAAHERTSVQAHNSRVLTIPLTEDVVLEAQTEGANITWETRTGNHLAKTAKHHALYYPGGGRFLQLEIEFSAANEKILVPRFTQGPKRQSFTFPSFTLTIHTLLSGESLESTDCNGGVFIPTSTAVIGTDKSDEGMTLRAGEAVPASRGAIRNEGSFTVGVLAICPANRNASVAQR